MWLGQNPGSARTALEHACCCKHPSIHFTSIHPGHFPHHCPSILLHSDTNSKRGFNMAAKSKNAAASEKSTVAIRETKQQQHYRQSPPRHHMIKDDETLLIDPAIVAAENPDVSRLFICLGCLTVKASSALAGYSYPASCFPTLIPATAFIIHLPSNRARCTGEVLSSTRKDPPPFPYPLSPTTPRDLALCCLKQLLPSSIHWYTSPPEKHKIAPPRFQRLFTCSLHRTLTPMFIHWPIIQYMHT